MPRHTTFEKEEKRETKPFRFNRVARGLKQRKKDDVVVIHPEELAHAQFVGLRCVSCGLPFQGEDNIGKFRGGLYHVACFNYDERSNFLTFPRKTGPDYVFYEDEGGKMVSWTLWVRNSDVVHVIKAVRQSWGWKTTLRKVLTRFR